MINPNNKPQQNLRQNGFALVIALGLMAFVLLLLLSISTLIRVETRLADTTISTIQARQNALLGAQLALGNLQRLLGPDQRVTAHADILSTSSEAKQNFTGVWDTSTVSGGGATQIAWLASDWGRDNTSYIAQDSPNPGDDNVATLVGEGSVDALSEPNSAVYVSTANTSVQNLFGQTAGSYAWWVADENVKANVRPIDEQPAATAGPRQRFQSVLATASKEEASPLVLNDFTSDAINESQANRLAAYDQLQLVGYNQDGLRKQFHNLTVNSYGVLSNARDGGLKKDLSLAFELEDADFNSSVFAAAGNNPVPVLGTSIRAQPVFYDINGGRGPSWHLLRDYYTIYQRMLTPLTDPTFPAQHFLPNHDELGFPASARTNAWRELAATRFDKSGVLKEGTSGDPLLSNSMPYLIGANYMPYMQRWIQTMLLKFDPVAADDPTIASRDPSLNYVKPVPYYTSAAVFHNPYNVKIQHFGLMTVLDFFRFDIIFDNIQDGVREAFLNGYNNISFKLEPGIIQAGGSEVVFGFTGGGVAGFSQRGTPLVEDAIRTFTGNDSTISNARIAASDGPDVLVDFAPSGGGQNYMFRGFHNMGSQGQPLSAAMTNGNDRFATDLYSVSSFSNDFAIRVMQSDHGEWIGNPGQYDGANYNVARNPPIVDIDLHLEGSSLDPPVPFVIFESFLKPVDARLPFPVFALSNPFSPTRAAWNFSDNSTGFPVMGPAWQLDISNRNLNPVGSAVIQSSPDPDGGDDAYWGSSNTASGSLRNAPLELPVLPPQSIGHLQSANLAVLGTMPAMAVGNSYATPYLARSQIAGTFSNIFGQPRLYHDLSYHLNEALWDEYFFSSYSVPYNLVTDDFDEDNTAVGLSFDAAFDSGFSDANLYLGSLPNRRMQLLLGDAEDFDDAKAKLFDGSDQALAAGVGRSAENLLVSGAFNVNSTSVDAWAAVLAAGRGSPVYRGGVTAADTPSSNETPLARAAMPSQQAYSGDPTSNEAWSGYRLLSDPEIRDLAENIVDELKARVAARGAPFSSLGEFVNRQLSNDSFGLAGLLQSAIDKSGLNGDFETENGDYTTFPFPHPDNVSKASGDRATAMGAAAHINQADILQGIGSFIQVRSDTFKIRAYGDTRDPVTGKVISQAWCELLVQRIPSPVHPNGSNSATDPSYWEPDPTQPEFGRRFIILSTRFLDKDSV